MDKIFELKPVVGENIPIKSDMKYGEIYFSPEYATVGFLCPCGCGQEVSLPTKSQLWSDIKNAPIWDCVYENGEITLSPSVLNRVGCKSHFFVRKNKVIWC